MSQVPHPTSAWPVAPLDPADLAPAMAPFGRSTMLPAAAYTSPEVLAWERRHLIAGSWPCLGRRDELATTSEGSPVTQRAVRAGDIAVLLTFGRDGSTRAFANTCRHRGHELLPEDGTATGRSVLCPYHAWSYRLDGDLIGAPGFRDVPGFDRADHGLVELPCEIWAGWLFVDGTGTAVPFAEHLGGFADLAAPYAPESLQLRARHGYEVAANWKVVCENYHECYHCPLIHPELCQVSPPTSGDNYDLPGGWVGGRMDLAPGAATMSISGASDGVPIPGVDPRSVRYLGLLPNLMLTLHPDYVMTHRMLPLAPDRTWIECSWYFPRVPGGGVDPGYAVEFWDLTNRQDWAACESVQRGLASPHFRPGPLAPNEDAVYDLVTLIGRAYQGIPTHVRTEQPVEEPA